MQTGFGAKAKNLLQLQTEYKGVSWRWVANIYTRQYITCKNEVLVFLFVWVFLALEAMKPSRQLQHYPVSRRFCVIHKLSPRCQLHIVTELLETCLLFTVCCCLFATDILRKFNPTIKGMSKGLKESGFNFAVSGAKVAWVCLVHFHWVLLKDFVHLWNLSFSTEESPTRCGA